MSQDFKDSNKTNLQADALPDSSAVVSSQKELAKYACSHDCSQVAIESLPFETFLNSTIENLKDGFAGNATVVKRRSDIQDQARLKFEELGLSNRECARILLQEERYLSVFNKRLSGDSLADLSKMVAASEARLLKKFSEREYSSSDKEIALKALRKKRNSVVVEKMRATMQAYLRSGTDYGLASGRLWAARSNRAAYMTLLFGDFNELESAYAELMSDKGFVLELKGLRDELELEQLYHEIRLRYERRQRICNALKDKGLEFAETLAQADVYIKTRFDFSIFDFVSTLGKVVWGDGRSEYANLLSQIDRANPHLSCLFDEGAEHGFDLVNLAAGTRVDLTSTDIGWECRLSERELCVKILKLIQKPISSEKYGFVGLSKKASLAIAEAIAELENQSKGLAKRTRRNSSEDLTKEGKAVAPQFSRILLCISKIEPSNEHVFEYLRCIVPAVNVACL